MKTSNMKRFYKLLTTGTAVSLLATTLAAGGNAEAKTYVADQQPDKSYSDIQEKQYDNGIAKFQNYNDKDSEIDKASVKYATPFLLEDGSSIAQYILPSTLTKTVKPSDKEGEFDITLKVKTEDIINTRYDSGGGSSGSGSSAGGGGGQASETADDEPEDIVRGKAWRSEIADTNLKGNWDEEGSDVKYQEIDDMDEIKLSKGVITDPISEYVEVVGEPKAEISNGSDIDMKFEDNQLTVSDIELGENEEVTVNYTVKVKDEFEGSNDLVEANGLTTFKTDKNDYEFVEPKVMYENTEKDDSTSEDKDDSDKAEDKDDNKAEDKDDNKDEDKDDNKDEDKDDSDKAEDKDDNKDEDKADEDDKATDEDKSDDKTDEDDKATDEDKSDDKTDEDKSDDNKSSVDEDTKSKAEENYEKEDEDAIEMDIESSGDESDSDEEGVKHLDDESGQAKGVDELSEKAQEKADEAEKAEDNAEDAEQAEENAEDADKTVNGDDNKAENEDDAENAETNGKGEVKSSTSNGGKQAPSQSGGKQAPSKVAPAAMPNTGGNVGFFDKIAQWLFNK